MRALVYGVGATGARVARHFASNADLERLCLIEKRSDVLDEVVRSIGEPAEVAEISSLLIDNRLTKFQQVCKGLDVVVLTTTDDHCELALVALEAGCHVVSVSDDVDTTEHLKALEPVAIAHDVTLAIGAGFAPGLSCVLASHNAARFDEVSEVHIAKFGTGGPECARQHHKALRSEALDWQENEWVSRRGGSGRELCWFPDPVGGLDCYQGGVPDVTLLLPAFPEATRVTTRVAANRRDRSTKWLPMLRRPHPEGLIGAVRAEVRGKIDDVESIVILGALDRPAVAAGHVAALTARWAHDGRLSPGAAGLASLITQTTPFLQELARCGVKAAAFEGARDDAFATVVPTA